MTVVPSVLLCHMIVGLSARAGRSQAVVSGTVPPGLFAEGQLGFDGSSRCFLYVGQATVQPGPVFSAGSALPAELELPVVCAASAGGLDSFPVCYPVCHVGFQPAE